MAGEDMVMVRQGELKRLHVIQKVLERVIKQVEAAEILLLSGRQFEGSSKRIRTEGDRGIVHQSRGRPSNRRTPDKVRDKVHQALSSQYKDFGPTLASEKLLERDRIEISDETLRKWLLEAGIGRRHARRRGHRHWREPKKPYGGDAADGRFSSRLV